MTSRINYKNNAHLVFALDLCASQTLSLVLPPITHANSLCVESIEQTGLLAKRTQGITPAHKQPAAESAICFIVGTELCVFSLTFLCLFG